MISLDIGKLSGQQLVSYYLMASYLYYNLDESCIADQEFDALCVRLLTEYDSIEHPHKHLVTKDDLQAGTGYRLTAQIAPLRLQLAALHWRDSCSKQSKSGGASGKKRASKSQST